MGDSASLVVRATPLLGEFTKDADAEFTSLENREEDRQTTQTEKERERARKIR